MSLSFGSSKSKSTPQDMTPEAFKALAGPVAAQLRNLFSTGGGPTFEGVPTVASGNNPFAAPVGQNESDILARLMGNLDASSASTGASRDLLTRTMSGAFLPGADGANPFLGAAIEAAQRPLIEAFQREIIPNLRTSFTRAGQFIQPGQSSPFEEAAAIASSGLANSLADIGTKIGFQAFDAERGRQQTAATQLPQIEQAEIESTINVLQQQALPRLVEQFGIDRGLEEFRRRVDVLLQALGIGAGAAAPTVANASKSSGFQFGVGLGKTGGTKGGTVTG